MKKSLLVSSLGIALAAVSTNALADVKVRGGVASGNYEFIVSAPGFGSSTIKSDYTPLTVGLTVVQDNGWYLDGSYSGGGGKHDGWNPKQNFTHSDLALVAGKNFSLSDSGTGGSFYLGFKSGSTTMEYPASSGGDDVFTASGVVLGGGLGFPIASGTAGFIGVNLGVGLMNGKYESPGISSSALKADNTVGASFGLSYTYPISSRLGLAADYKSNAYKYKFDIFGTPVDVDEKLNTVGVTLSYAM